jgi:hypothetical protein
MAGASYKGQYEERIKSVLEEISKSETHVILFIVRSSCILKLLATGGYVADLPFFYRMSYTSSWLERATTEWTLLICSNRCWLVGNYAV